MNEYGAIKQKSIWLFFPFFLLLLLNKNKSFLWLVVYFSDVLVWYEKKRIKRFFIVSCLKYPLIFVSSMFIIATLDICIIKNKLIDSVSFLKI